VALLDPRIGLTLLVAAAIAGPHLAWLVTDAASPSAAARLRFAAAADDGMAAAVARPLVDVVVDLAAFLSPLSSPGSCPALAARRPIRTPRGVRPASCSSATCSRSWRSSC
jgi:hypothetical protein